MLDKSRLDAEINKPACDAALSRKEFLTKLVQRAAVAGTLVAAPQIIDKFLVPPAQALNSTTSVHDTSGAHDQTQHFHDTHAPLRDGGSHGGGSHGGSHDGGSHGGSHDGGSHGTSSPNASPEGGTSGRRDIRPDTGVDDWG